MPWTGASFRRKHNHGLTDRQAEVAATVANRVLEQTGDEKKAVVAGNAAAKKVGKNRI